MIMMEITENQMAYISGLVGSVCECLKVLNETLKGQSQVQVSSLIQFTAIASALTDIRSATESRNEIKSLVIQLSQDLYGLKTSLAPILAVDAGDHITVDMVDDLRSRINDIENRMVTDQQGVTNVIIDKLKEALSVILPDIVDDSAGQLKLFSELKAEADRKIRTLITQVPVLELDHINQNRHYYPHDEVGAVLTHGQPDVIQDSDLIAGHDKNGKAFIIFKTDTGNITVKASKVITLEQGKQIFELHSQGVNDKEIAFKTGLTHKKITHYRLHTLGLRIREVAPKSNKKWDGIDDQYLIDNHVSIPEYEMAKYLGRSIGAIKRRIITLKLDKSTVMADDILQPTNEEKEVFI
jgi:hypothetical protein